MLYNYNYRLPVIKSTYKSNYGKGRDDIISHDVEYYDLPQYSLRLINKTITAYEDLITKLHKVSYSNLKNMQAKNIEFKEIILKELNLIVENRYLNELDIVTIEHYFIDRKEKLEIIRDKKKFDHDMKILANRAKKSNCVKNKKSNHCSSNNSDILTPKASDILTTVGIENV